MSRIQMLVMFMLLLALPGIAGADRPPVHFAPGNTKGGAEAMVAEFLDPGATGLGRALSYVIWHELVSALGNPTGTDVILLHPPAGEGVMERLKQGRHEAALDIAKQYRTPMMLWGEVKVRRRGSRARVTVQTSLTLNPKGRVDDLSLRLTVTQGDLTRHFQAEFPQTRFDFARVRIRRADLFARQLATRTATTLHAEPSATTPAAAHVPAGTVLRATDLQGSWFAVRHPNGAHAYIDRTRVRVLPRRADVEQPYVYLRQGPGAEYPSTVRVDLQGAVEILNIRDHVGQNPWYRLQAQDTDGWVPGTVVRPRFDFPAQHFLICLSHYQNRRFEDAYRACSQFIGTQGDQETNVNLATAYQVQGASRLVFKDPFSYDAATDMAAFSKAVDLTPFDPAAYNLRALARFGVTRRLDDVFADLKQALALDPENLGARAFVRSLDDLADGEAFDLPKLDWIEPFLNVERIRQGSYHQLPQQARELGPNATGEDVLLTLDNRTDDALRLYLVGNITRTIDVPAGQSEDVGLTAGTYALAAEFSPDPVNQARKVRPLYGIQSYNTKTHYALKFYVQRRSGG